MYNQTPQLLTLTQNDPRIQPSVEPQERQINSTGFTSHWHVTMNNYEQFACADDHCQQLAGSVCLPCYFRGLPQISFCNNNVNWYEMSFISKHIWISKDDPLKWTIIQYLFHLKSLSILNCECSTLWVRYIVSAVHCECSTQNLFSIFLTTLPQSGIAPSPFVVILD